MKNHSLIWKKVRNLDILRTSTSCDANPSNVDIFKLSLLWRLTFTLSAFPKTYSVEAFLVINSGQVFAAAD